MQFVTPTISDLRFAVDLNAEGNIAMSGETASGQKNFTIKNFRTSFTEPETLNDFISADNIVTRLMSIVLGTFTQASLRQTIVRKVE